MLHSVGNNLHQVVLNPGSLKDFFHGAEEKMGQGDDNYHEGLAVTVRSNFSMNISKPRRLSENVTFSGAV